VVEERTEDEREDGAPLALREPQDERNEASSGKRKSRKGIGGPKTEAGKAAVQLNAMKHGVLALRQPAPRRSGQAPTPVLPLVESEERWEELRRTCSIGSNWVGHKLALMREGPDG